MGPIGLITSPGFPQSYRNRIDCTWTIQLSIGLLIHFNFLHFDLYPSENCVDSLKIYDGGSNTSPMLGNPYCGNSPPPSHSQISSSNQLFIHFRTDTSDTGGGFKLE